MQTNRFMYLGESFKGILEEHKTDATNYDETMSSGNIILWQVAMKTKLESMYSNRVWDLIKAPKRINLIGFKWVYKRKKWVNEKVETYKARLVVKGYS